MSIDIDEAIAQANQRLKAAKMRVSIERRNDRLWLRATLPPKPHLGKSKPYQQKVSLGAKATAAGLQYAEQKAKLMAAQLDLNRFDWSEWIKANTIEGETVGYWIERFEEDFWSTHKRTLEKEDFWKASYWETLKRLPQDEALTLELLVNHIKSVPPDTRSRKGACTCCYALAEFASLEGREIIRKYAGSYSRKTVDPRNLPSDAEIANLRNEIVNPGWQWILGIMATYGLRNHEVFHLNLQDFPTVRILKGKTGDRVVLPLYPEWATSWQLDEMRLPRFRRDLSGYSNRDLGRKIARAFWTYKFPFTAYDLRHCYARRCFEFGIAPDRAAKLMGHSIAEHTNTYRAWISEETYLKIFKQEIYREGRPLPPSI